MTTAEIPQAELWAPVKSPRTTSFALNCSKLGINIASRKNGITCPIVGAVPQDLAKVLKNGRWDEAAGPYEFSENGALKKRRITDKVFKDKKIVEFTEETANER